MELLIVKLFSILTFKFCENKKKDNCRQTVYQSTNILLMICDVNLFAFLSSHPTVTSLTYHKTNIISIEKPIFRLQLVLSWKFSMELKKKGCSKNQKWDFQCLMQPKIKLNTEHLEFQLNKLPP